MADKRKWAGGKSREAKNTPCPDTFPRGDEGIITCFSCYVASFFHFLHSPFTHIELYDVWYNILIRFGPCVAFQPCIRQFWPNVHHFSANCKSLFGPMAMSTFERIHPHYGHNVILSGNYEKNCKKWITTYEIRWNLYLILLCVWCELL